MLTTAVRTAILYLFVILGIRIMGKRQIGDMQPNELVITILMSEIAAIPIQDVSQPVLLGVVAIFMLVILEILISVLTMKSRWARRLVNGKPAILICNGRLDQKLMRKLRVNMSDLMEVLRTQGIFNIEQVAYAILETNGNLSVLKLPVYENATAGDVGKTPENKGLPALVICDGSFAGDGTAGGVKIDRSKVDNILKNERVQMGDVFLMTLDDKGNYHIIRQEGRS